MADRHSGAFLRRFAVLFGSGLVGIVALLPMIGQTVRAQMAMLPPEVQLGYPALLALSLVNPLILLALGVMVGIRLAPRVGLRSLLDEWAATRQPILPHLAPHLPAAIALGLGGGAATIILDLGFQSWIGVLGGADDAGAPSPLASLVGGLLYGGITEELMLRWGMMSFLTWAGWRLIGRGRGEASDSVVWGAIVGAAIAFGIGHLPALAAIVPLTAPIVLRTVVLNALAGTLFGWLFWRRSLEAAMVAHATFHLAFAAAGLVA